MIELPWPAKILWPNGRGHHMAKHREAKKHKQWAFNATLAHLGQHPVRSDAKSYSLVAVFHPKTANAVDEDNAAASLKYYQDGIAAAIGVDDKHFLAPVVMFGEPAKGGKVIILIGVNTGEG